MRYHCKLQVNPFTPKISLELSLLSVIQFLLFWFREFGTRSTNNLLIYIILKFILTICLRDSVLIL